ncbi:uncharacterized protein LOC131315030 [Rhododendron vialii]|uniref:uncharacterized protein LOC131315030 n=1 Tax=Rhododendron vialii TaxID=182163 RepID=UPI002660276E|nr:uncharacterized protein LOC131315030 [Rhododendron vialii]
MEDKSIDAAIATKVVPTVPPTATNGKKTPTEGEKARNKRGGFTFIKAAMFMVRRGPSGKSKPPVASNDKLMKLVGSMRPLHLQDNQSPPPSIGKQSEEMISTPLSSPDRPSSSSSSVDSMSQYGSATNLQALDKGGVMRSYASSPNLQGLVEVDKGSESSESRYASSTNLQRSSRYASAKDLLELELKGDDSGDDDDENDEDSDNNNNGGDEMIDAKADEFIAKFYNQMKLQHMHSF